MQGFYNKMSRIHRSQREIYQRVPAPLVKYEQYPQQDLTMSQPILGRMIPGFKDPAITALPQVYDRVKRKPFQYNRVQMLNEPEIPGVPGSGRLGKEMRDKQEQAKRQKMAMMGDANKDPAELQKLQQLLSGGQQQVQQSATQQVSIPNQLDWR